MGDTHITGRHFGGDTHITSVMCEGIHISRGYTYHCDNGFVFSFPFISGVSFVFLSFIYFATFVTFLLSCRTSVRGSSVLCCCRNHRRILRTFISQLEALLRGKDM